uniref:Uncharacterized protein n=1 Tax=Poecilia mexicana TaxID=48701 RepID=A0A3B3XTF0_9TELE
MQDTLTCKTVFVEVEPIGDDRDRASQDITSDQQRLIFSCKQTGRQCTVTLKSTFLSIEKYLKHCYKKAFLLSISFFTLLFEIWKYPEASCLCILNSGLGLCGDVRVEQGWMYEAVLGECDRKPES